MVHSRATTPGSEKTPSRDSGNGPQSGNILKASSDPGARRASSPTKTSASSIQKAKSSAGSSHHSAPAPRSPVKHVVTKKPAVKKGKAAKPATTAALCRPARTKKESVRLVDETTASHPAVKKKAAAPKKKPAAKTDAGVKKPTVKKAAPKKSATTPKKPAPKKPTPKEPATKKPAAKKGTGVKKAAFKPKANTKKKVVPKKK